MAASVRSIRTGKRVVSALAAGLIAVPLSVTAMGSTAIAATTPSEQSITDLCANIPADFDMFTDDNGANAEAAINCLAWPGIVQGGPGGTAPTSYGPQMQVTRAQMATFIARALDEVDALDNGNNITALPAAADSPDAFTDDNGNPHEANINRLAKAGIVQGGPGGLPATEYGPTLLVQRDQMASFIGRAINYASTGDANNSVIATNNDYFTDDEGDVHEDNINGIASMGIAIGTGNNLYEPAGKVSRAQMAMFIARTIATALSNGAINAIPQSLTPPANLNATVGDFDTSSTDTSNNDVQITFDAATGGLIKDYYAYVAPADPSDTATQCNGTPIGGANSPTAFPSDGASTTIVIPNLANGDYCSMIAAESAGPQGSDFSNKVTFTISVPAAQAAVTKLS